MNTRTLNELEAYICYALYEDLDGNPLQRFDDIEEARKGKSSRDYLVVEVSTYRLGTLCIEELRISDAPKVWIPVKYKPEYDGEYLCHIAIKEDCGVLRNEQRVMVNSNAKWIKEDNVLITHWMIIRPPKVIL